MERTGWEPVLGRATPDGDLHELLVVADGEVQAQAVDDGRAGRPAGARARIVGPDGYDEHVVRWIK